MSWRNEFKASYDVPEAELLTLGFHDTSWHNDAAPSFMRSWDGTDNFDNGFLRVWTDHPDPQERDCDTQEATTRFGLDVAIDSDEGESALCTNDFELVIKIIRVIDFCLENRNNDNLLWKVVDEFKETFPGAFVQHTGGGIHVTQLQLTPTEAIGVSEDCVVLYRSAQPKDADTIIFDCEEQHYLAVLQGGADIPDASAPTPTFTVREALQALVDAHDQQPPMLTEAEWRNARCALRTVPEPTLAEIRTILWPSDDPEKQWTPDTIAEIALLVGRKAR